MEVGAAQSDAGYSRALVVCTTMVMTFGTYYVYDSIAPVAEALSSQLHLSDSQIGLLNAVFSLPNIALALVGGMAVDRFGARRVVKWTAAACLIGTALSAVSPSFPMMVAGRFLFGVGGETLMVAVMTSLATWFTGRNMALVMAASLSFGRLGSYLADRSPSFASALYSHGWQAPLWLATGVFATAFLAAMIFSGAEYALPARAESATVNQRVSVRGGLRFSLEYWYVVGVCVAFYSAIVPFRSTFAIKYLQHSYGLPLDVAGRMNSYVYLVAMVAMPVLGYLTDRQHRGVVLRQGLLLGSVLLPISFIAFANKVPPWIPMCLLGAGFSLVPAVLFPSVARSVAAQHRGTAYGLMSVLQNCGLTLANLAVGHMNDAAQAGADNPGAYSSMLWFFGITGGIASIFAVTLLARPIGSGEEDCIGEKCAER